MQSGPFAVITGTRNSQDGFSGPGTKARCCCLFCLAFEAARPLIEFIIPALESARMAPSHSGQGSATPARARPAPTPDKQPFFSPPCDGDPGATSAAFTPASLQEVTGHDGLLKSPGSIVTPNTVTRRHALVLFAIQAQCLRRKRSWRAPSFLYPAHGRCQRADLTAAGENPSSARPAIRGRFCHLFDLCEECLATGVTQRRLTDRVLL